MPETLLVNNFSAGWTPSDDSINGRANGLLQMDNLELDRNGALQLIHGTQIVYSGFSAQAHTMYSRFINNLRYDYSALTDGSVYRNNTQVLTGGSPTNAAFGTAFNFTLICSGTKRFKDSGTSLIDLGILPPTSAPQVFNNQGSVPYAEIGTYMSALVAVAGTFTLVPSSSNYYLQCVSDNNGVVAVQSDFSTPYNCTVLTGPGGSGTSTDDDFIVVNGYIPSPFGVSLQFDVLLRPGDSAGDSVSDMYTYAVTDISQQANFDSITGVFTISIPRSSFNRTGSGAFDWSTVYGYRITVIYPDPTVQFTINLWGTVMSDGFFKIQGGTTAQFGTYQYAQVNVNNTGSYLAKSVLGPVSNPITLNGTCAQVTVQNPTTVDPQCNEAWIFRSGGNLGGTWYRIAVVTSPFASPIYDTMGDQNALELDITIDPNLISVASIPDSILDIIGPVSGRWYYFTDNFMYPSDLEDPDLVNASLAVRVSGSASELFMWARAVSASVILIGTSIDCYLLTGTFSTFPDGTIDVYYQSLGVKFPPVTYDAVSFGGAVYYLATDGWRFVLPTSFGTTYSSQNNQSMVAPNTDRLYRGEVANGYAPANMPTSPGSVRFPITITKNKLWCFPQTGNGRGEVWDFARQYWRAFYYQPQFVTACTATQDNKVLVFCGNDLKIREYDYAGSKLIDGGGVQAYNMLFTYRDNGKPRQRKDTYTFKSRCNTAGSTMYLHITDEKNNVINIVQGLYSTAVTETYVDLSAPFNPANSINPQYLPKAYQVQLFGTGSDLILEDWSIDFDARPVPLTFLRLYPSNLGSATKKRLRTWPLVIDTLGNSIIFTPDVDGVPQSPTIFSTKYKQTVFCYFTTDIFGIDYGGTLYDPAGLMEVWDTGNGQLGQGLTPEIVQNLPINKEFDQVGPIEIFRFGKIVKMVLRVSSTGTPIPFKIYLGDILFYQNEFDVTPGVEDDYVVDFPKGVSGRILRLELGPCNFVFNRYYVKFQVAMSGTEQDTELRWIAVPGGG